MQARGVSPVGASARRGTGVSGRPCLPSKTCPRCRLCRPGTPSAPSPLGDNPPKGVKRELRRFAICFIPAHPPGPAPKRSASDEECLLPHHCLGCYDSGCDAAPHTEFRMEAEWSILCANGQCQPTKSRLMPPSLQLVGKHCPGPVEAKVLACQQPNATMPAQIRPSNFDLELRPSTFGPSTSARTNLQADPWSLARRASSEPHR